MSAFHQSETFVLDTDRRGGNDQDWWFPACRLWGGRTAIAAIRPDFGASAASDQLRTVGNVVSLTPMIVRFLISILVAVNQNAIAPDVQKREPITYVSYVGYFEHECTYMTGDVLFDRAQFQHDLKARFDRHNNMIIYYGASVPQRCINKARKVAERVGFRKVQVEIAPENLEMGPPR